MNYWVVFLFSVEIYGQLKKYHYVGALGWLSRWAANLGSGHDLTVCGFEPRVGLCAGSSEPGSCFGFCVCLSLCLSPAHALSLSVSKINKNIKNVFLITLKIPQKHNFCDCLIVSCMNDLFGYWKQHIVNVFLFIWVLKHFFNFYLLCFRDRDRTWMGEEQRDRETQNPKEASGSELSAQSPMQGLNPRTVTSWPKLKLDV